MQDWQIPLGRRFRALKVWFVLRTYGQKGLQDYLQHHLNLAKLFAKLVQSDERFEITAPPRFALVCFALKVCVPLLGRHSCFWTLIFMWLVHLHAPEQTCLTHAVACCLVVMPVCMLVSECMSRTAGSCLTKYESANDMFSYA